MKYLLTFLFLNTLLANLFCQSSQLYPDTLDQQYWIAPMNSASYQTNDSTQFYPGEIERNPNLFYEQTAKEHFFFPDDAKKSHSIFQADKIRKQLDESLKDSDIGYTWVLSTANNPDLISGPARVSLSDWSISNIKDDANSGLPYSSSVFVEDRWIGIKRIFSSSSFNEADTETGLETELFFYTQLVIRGIAYHPDHEFLYAIHDRIYGSDLYKINLETGDYYLVGQTGATRRVLGLAFDNNGVLYGVDVNINQLVTLSVNNGVATPVGPIGFDVDVRSELIYDKNNGVLYGIFTDDICTINTETGAATIIGSTNYDFETIAIPYDFAHPEAPSKVSDFEVFVADSGALEATLSWTNPTLTHNGTELEDFTSVSIRRNAHVIATIQNPQTGANEVYVDNQIPESDLYNYTLHASNSHGNGERTSFFIFAGEDIPSPPDNLLLNKEGNYANLSWDMPTTGANGGYLNNDSVWFDIIRRPGTITVAEGVLETSFIDSTITNTANYTYKVKASNSDGTSESDFSNTLLITNDDYLVFEQFDDYYGTGLPWGWYFEDEPNHSWTLRTFFPYENVVEVSFVMSGTPAGYGMDRVLFRPVQVTEQETLMLHFDNFVSDHITTFEGEKVAVDVSYDDGNGWTTVWEMNVIESLDVNRIFSPIEVPGNVSSMNIALRFEGNSGNIYLWGIDNFIVEPAHQNDLAILSFKGDPAATEGTPVEYIVEIFNLGLQTQSNYAVVIMKDDTELMRIGGESVAFMDTLEYSFSWTPGQADLGKISLSAYIEFQDDEWVENNQSSEFAVNVYPSHTQAISIGDQASEYYLPYSFNRVNSISQTIYFQDEIGIENGKITGIKYFNNFNLTVLEARIQIWMGETDSLELVNGWIDPSELQLVFDSNMQFPQGENEIEIQLDQYYEYQGGNLVIYSYKEDDLNGFVNYFYCSRDNRINRTRRVASDQQLDPLNPELDYPNLLPFFPNIHLLFAAQPIGDVEGVITDMSGPVEGIKATIQPLGKVVFSDENGFYKFPSLPVGLYNIKFEKTGYVSTYTDALQVLENLVIENNLTITKLPVFNFEGVITGNDGAIIEKASILLQDDNNNYTRFSNTEGEFIFEELPQGQYVLEVSAERYSKFVDSIFVLQSDSFQSIELTEYISAPLGLKVHIDSYDDGEAMLSWVGQGADFLESFESGNFPDDWKVINTANSGHINLRPWWNIRAEVGLEPPVIPKEGDYQAFMMWSLYHQDEWLITPRFIAPKGNLEFWYFGTNGSPYGDNYYVKVSANDGDSWDVLWNASDLPAGVNHYDYPVVIDLSAYAGQEIKIAWNNVGGSDGKGVHFPWAIDKISVGGQKIRTHDMTIESESEKRLNQSTKNDLHKIHASYADCDPKPKSFHGYNIYLNNEIVATAVQDLEFLFKYLVEGLYVAGVESVYSTGVSEISEIEFEITNGFEETFARVQIIQNSPDYSLESVDIYNGDQLLVEDLNFRAATSFLDLPAEIELFLYVGSSNKGVKEAAGPFNISFNSNETYIVIASGLINGNSYAPNEPFGLKTYDMAREAAIAAGNTDILLFHGSTDAPYLSIWAEGMDNQLLVFGYGDFKGYLEMPDNDYVFEIRDFLGENVIAVFDAPLSTLGLGGKAISIVTSGFLTPENNNNGASFGLWLATADGGQLIELPLITSVQESDLTVGNIKMFPNPTKDVVFFRSKNLISQISLIDMSGRVIYKGIVEDVHYQMAVDKFENGIYFVQIVTEEGTFMAKLQVQR